MDAVFADLQFWHWWILGLVLGVIEILAPGAFFIWLGVAAAIVGLVVLIVPVTPWEIQLLLFAVVAVASIVGWRAYQRRHPTESEDTTLNRRGEQYVGRVFTIGEPIIDGRGRMRVGDSMWRISGPDMPAGERVRVTGVSGNLLEVVRADPADLHGTPQPEARL